MPRSALPYPYDAPRQRRRVALHRAPTPLWAGLLAGLLLGGCAATRCEGSAPPAPSPPGPPSAAVEPAPGASAGATLRPVEGPVLTLYFANPQYVATGDEALPHLVSEARSTPPTEALAAAALRELLEVGPRAGGVAVAPPGVRARVGGVTGGVVTVDFDREGLAGGSLAETMLLAAIVWTLTELPGVDAVRFTVAGATAESLMGHVDTIRPLRRADLGR